MWAPREKERGESLTTWIPFMLLKRLAVPLTPINLDSQIHYKITFVFKGLSSHLGRCNMSCILGKLNLLFSALSHM